MRGSNKGSYQRRLGGSEQGLTGLRKLSLTPLSEGDFSLVGDEDPVVIVVPMRLINNSESGAG